MFTSKIYDEQLTKSTVAASLTTFSYPICFFKTGYFLSLLHKKIVGLIWILKVRLISPICVLKVVTKYIFF